MLTHLMTCNTWAVAKHSLINESGRAQTFSNQKQDFMSIQILSGETAPAFVQKFNCKAQVLVKCVRLGLMMLSQLLSYTWKTTLISKCT